MQEEEIQTELVKEGEYSWWVYVIIGSERIWGLGSTNGRAAMRDKERIERGDLYYVIIHSKWYRDAKAAA